MSLKLVQVVFAAWLDVVNYLNLLVSLVFAILNCIFLFNVKLLITLLTPSSIRFFQDDVAWESVLSFLNNLCYLDLSGSMSTNTTELVPYTGDLTKPASSETQTYYSMSSGFALLALKNRLNIHKFYPFIYIYKATLAGLRLLK